ncbi:MAG: Crp/Fnr family transcriptional regulator [Fibrobacteres bacterium]|nr:Crp/Fnr family transcriptional regulator [Fibrobacterota bacterium]
MLPSDLLKQTDFFKGVTPRSRKLLSEILIPKTVKKGGVLFNEGEKGFAVYLCGSGSIQLVRHTKGGKETVIKLIGAGEMFAEVILFEFDTYPVTAVALTRSTVYLLPKMQFLCLLEDADFRSDFISNLMKKLRYLAQQIVDLTSLTVEERFVKYIHSLEEKGGEYIMPISKKEIASALGTNPETISRVLSSLKEKGLISTEGRKIRFLKG